LALFRGGQVLYDSIQDFIDIFFSKSDFEGSRKRSALLQNKGGDYRLKYDFFFRPLSKRSSSIGSTRQLFWSSLLDVFLSFFFPRQLLL